MFEITPETHDNELSQNRILVIYTASWCSPCKVLLRNIPAFESILKEKGITLNIATIDISNVKLKNSFASAKTIEAVPTIRLYQNNMIKHEISGGYSAKKLWKQLKKFLREPVEENPKAVKPNKPKYVTPQLDKPQLDKPQLDKPKVDELTKKIQRRMEKERVRALSIEDELKKIRQRELVRQEQEALKVEHTRKKKRIAQEHRNELIKSTTEDKLAKLLSETTPDENGLQIINRTIRNSR